MTDHSFEVSEQDNRSEATLQTDAKEAHNNQHAPEDRASSYLEPFPLLQLAVLLRYRL